MPDYVYKSSITGAFVSAQYAADHPDTTYRDTLGNRDDEPQEAPHGCGDEPPAAINPDPEFDGDEGYPPEAA